MKTLELRTYQQTLLREYVRRKYKLSDIPLMELDISFIEGYEYFLTIDRKLKRGSICSALAALKAVVNKAVKNGMIDMYPFIGYSYEKTKGTPRNITQDDLQKIIDLPINGRNIVSSVICSCSPASAVLPFQIYAISKRKTSSLKKESYVLKASVSRRRLLFV